MPALAGVPEWPKGAGCKPAGSAFRGSNPLPCKKRDDGRREEGCTACLIPMFKRGDARAQGTRLDVAVVLADRTLYG